MAGGCGGVAGLAGRVTQCNDDEGVFQQGAYAARDVQYRFDQLQFMQDGARFFRYGEPLGQHAGDEGVVQAEVDADEGKRDGRAGLVHDFPDGKVAVNAEYDAGKGDAADGDEQKGDECTEGDGVAQQRACGQFAG